MLLLLTYPLCDKTLLHKPVQKREDIMAPQVSVIIPAYNAEMFICDSIKSILNQDLSLEIEIIVIDDDSSDETKLLVSQISQTHPQVMCVPNLRKKGPSGARNTGLLKATGKYIAFLDADDVWLPNHLAEGISFLDRKSDIDLVFFNFHIVDYATKTRIGDWFTKKEFTKTLEVNELEGGYFHICSNVADALLVESFMHLQSMIIRRDKAKGFLFNEYIKRSEDRDFAIKLFGLAKARCAYKDAVTGIYFRHPNSLTSNTIQNSLSTVLDHITLFSSYLSGEISRVFTTDKLKEIIFDRYMKAAYYYRQLHQYKLSLHCVKKSCGLKLSNQQLKEVAKIICSAIISCISPTPKLLPSPKKAEQQSLEENWRNTADVVD